MQQTVLLTTDNTCILQGTDVQGSKPCKQQLTNRVIWQAVNLHLKDDFIINFSVHFLGIVYNFLFFLPCANAQMRLIRRQFSSVWNTALL